MKFIRKFTRLVIVLLFVFSLLPVPLAHFAEPAQAAGGWMKYPGQLTLQDGGVNQKYVIDAHVIKDGSTYKMWFTYVKMDLTPDQIGASLKTLNAAALFTALQNFDFNGFINALADINPDLATIQAIFDGIAGTIGYAESTDGKTWNVLNQTALAGASGGIWTSVGFPTVLKIDDTTYKMWFTRLETTLTKTQLANIFTNMKNATPAQRRTALDALLNSTRTVIGYATSPNGRDSWTVQSPTALAGTGGTWLAFNSAFAPSVILDGSTLKMWFSRPKTDFSVDIDALLAKIPAGLTVTDLAGVIDGTTFVIGYAESTNGGMTFAVNVNPQVFTGGNGLWQSVLGPSVFKTGSTYEMWYTQYSSTMVRGTLQGLIHNIQALNLHTLWNSLKTKTFGEFLNDIAAINTLAVETALVGTTTTIGYTTSNDGTTWAAPDPVDLTGVTNTPWGGVGMPSVVISPAMSEIWFSQGFASLQWTNIVDFALGAKLPIGYANTKLLTSISVTPTSWTVPKGRTVQYTAMGTFNDSTTQNLTNAPGIIWTSSNINKATIDAAGLARGIDIGTTGITATYGGITSNTAILNVGSPVLQAIVITPADQNIPLGRTLQLTATGTFSDLSTANVTTLVDWSITAGGTFVSIGANTGLASSLAVGGPATIRAQDPVTGVFNTTSLTVGPAVYDYLLITPDSPSLAKGDTLQLSAIAYNTDGTWTDQTANATWTSDNGNATVSNTAPTKGLLTGANVGTSTITATYNGKNDTTLATVTAARLTGIAITGATTMIPGPAPARQITLGIAPTYSDGATAPVPPGIVWASLNPDKATVDAAGVVTGIAQGTATIRATVQGFTATHVITVQAPALDTVTVLPGNPFIPHLVGTPGTVQFSAQGTYSDLSTAPLTSGIAWSKPAGTDAIATLSAGGLATSAGAGAVTITATHTATGKTGNTVLTVIAAPLTAIAITPTTTVPGIPKGTNQQYAATGTFGTVPPTAGVVITQQVTWNSSNTSVATIGANTGLATAVASSGTSNITATLSGVTSNTAVFTAAPPVVTGVTVTPATPSVPKGGTGTQVLDFTATGRYSDNTTAPLLNTAVTWTVTAGTGNATVTEVTVGGNDYGRATGTAVGTATIKATHDATGNFGNTTLTVTPSVLDSIAVTSTTVYTIAAGGTLQMVATGTYSDNTTPVITNNVSWTSSDPSIAYIDTAGKVWSTATGTTNITARLDGKTSPAVLITVTAPTVTSITIDPVGAVIPAGTTRNFRAIANYTDGSKVVLTSGVTWSSDSANATVSASGVVTGAAQGGANIKATHNATGLFNTAAVTVTTGVLNSITVTPNPGAVAAGKTLQLTATGNYSNGTADITNMVTWSTDAPAVARVNQAGLAGGLVVGSANISATFGGKVGTAVLNVTAAVLDSISVTPVNPGVIFIAGAPPTLQFKATGVYSDGTIADVTATATWTSSNTAVANNPVAGLATTKDPGAGSLASTISATSGGKTGTSTLTVAPDTVAPVAKITSPADGMTTSNRNITVTGNINDLNAPTKQLILNGVASNLTLDGSGNFSVGVILNDGNNTIQIKAIDGAGNIGVSGTITVKVDPQKPAVTLTSPADGALTNNPAVTIAGSATSLNGINKVNVILNGVTTVVNTTGVFTASLTLTPGTNIMCVTAYDKNNEGNSAWLGTSGIRTVVYDNAKPVIGINNPVNNSVTNTAGLTVTGTVDDPAITTANLRLNGGTPQVISVVNGRFSQNITLAQGLNTVSVTATDKAGNVSDPRTVNVTLDTSKPGVVINTPANNLRTNAASQKISGTVDDPTISTVLLLINGVSQVIPVIPNIVTKVGEFSKMETLGEGTYNIEVRATDAGSNIGTSGVVSIVIDTTPPNLIIGLTDPTASIGITVSSDEDLAAPPTVTVGATAVTMAPSGVRQWTGTYAIPGAGDYLVSVAGTGVAGNKATASASFTKRTINVTGTTPTSVVSATTTLQVETNGAVTGADISFTTHRENPSGNVRAPTDAGLNAGAFIEINAAPELLNNLKQIYIEVKYDRTTLPAGTDEDSLKLYLWDVASGTWQPVPNSGVDKVRQVIFGTVTHLSKYGGFGTTTSVTGPAPTPPSVPGVTDLTYKVTPEGQFIVDVIAPSSDLVCIVTIPRSTIGRTATGLALTNISAVKIEAAPVVPANQRAVGSAYELGPNGATFNPAVTIKFTYQDIQIPAGANENKIYIAWKDSAGNWNKLVSTVDAAGNTVTAKADHFTPFALIVPYAPATFTISNLTITPSEVKPGEKATVGVAVTNAGDLSGAYEVVLKIDGATVETKSVTVAGGASQTVTFQVSRDTAGTYSVAIGTLTGTLTVKEEIITPPPKPAAFTASGLTISPSSVKVGEGATITVTLQNTGELSGAYQVVLKVNGVTEATKEVTLAGGASQSVSFTVTKAQAGTYTINIDTLIRSLTVQEVVTPPPTTEVPVKPKPVNWTPIILGIIGGVIVIALVVVIVLRRTRKA